VFFLGHNHSRLSLGGGTLPKAPLPLTHPGIEAAFLLAKRPEKEDYGEKWDV